MSDKEPTTEGKYQFAIGLISGFGISWLMYVIVGAVS